MKLNITKLLPALFLVSGIVMVSPAQQQLSAADPLGNSGNQTSLTSANDSPVPILDGMDILLLLASSYGISKYFQVRKQEKT